MRHRPAATLAALSLAANLTACADGPEVYAPTPRPTAEFAPVAYATWTDDQPEYRLYPGDELDVQVLSAPELSKIVTILPDGRVSLPLVAPVLVADRSIEAAEAAISTAYAAQLLHPRVTINVRAAPTKVFVGGEVAKPGVYDMPGDINAAQAVIMAGGFTVSAKRSQVMLIRRGANGQPMMRTADLRHGITDPGHFDLVPLRRFDVIYVPRTGVAETGDFVQQYIRQILPVTTGFSYTVGGVVLY